MSKNESLSSTVGRMSVGEITRDEHFKNMVRYRAIAALLMKFTIPEFKDMSLYDIAKSIIDDKGKFVVKDASDKASVLDADIIPIKSESGTGEEKKTINDMVFKAEVDGETVEVELRSSSEITVNLEMQNTTKTKTLGYNLVSRAVYYGATLLRDTLHKGDSYSKIHKVYTIWFCNDNLGLREYVESEGKYVHYYDIRRFYPDVENRTAHIEAESDLIEIVMVELPKLRKEDSDVAEMVYKLFNETSNVISAIEASEGVKLEKVKEGVTGMLNYDEGFKTGREEERKESILDAVKMLIGMGLEQSQIIQNIAKSFSIDEGTALEAYKKCAK